MLKTIYFGNLHTPGNPFINRPQVEPQETFVHKSLLRLVADVNLAVHQVLENCLVVFFPPNTVSMGDPTPVNLEHRNSKLDAFEAFGAYPPVIKYDNGKWTIYR